MGVQASASLCDHIEWSGGLIPESPNQPLTVAVTVDIGGIDEIYAAFERFVQSRH